MNISSVLPTAAATTAASDPTQAHAKAAATVHSLSVGEDSESGLDDNSQAGRRQAALSLVNRTLTAAYETMSSRTKSAVAAYQEVEPLTPAKVANNILGFIERRLQADAADGATQEQLQTRLDAGLAGFNKGFAEASEKLKALGQLSPEIETDIGQSKDLVLKGIDDLRAKFIKTTEQPVDNAAVATAPAATAPAATPQVAPALIDPTTLVPSVPASHPSAAAQIFKSTPTDRSVTAVQVPNLFASLDIAAKPGNDGYSPAGGFSFQLTTAEGDKVTIRATTGADQAATTDANKSQTMSLKVDGDLSDDELKAINDLLAHVNDLAGQFFSGNLDEAFNQAVNLGYDKSQIGSFALSLVQVDIKPEAETPKVDTDTAAAAQPSNLPLFSLSDHLHPLGNFIKILLDALDLASKFDNPKGLLSDASINLVGKDDAGKVQAARFDNFSKQLLSLDLGKSTQSPDDVAAKN